MTRRITSRAALVIALAAWSASGESATAQAVDSVPPFERVNGALLRPGALTYSLSSSNPDRSLGTHVVTVVDTALGGVPAWLITDARRGTVLETCDSVFLTRADLSPLRWTAMIGRQQFGASFTRDSVFGVLDTYRGRTSFVSGVPGNVLLSAGMVARIVEMLPLRAGYRAGVSLLLVDAGGAKIEPLILSVEREEKTRSAGREVAAWVVLVAGAGIEQRLWVTQDASRVVQSEQKRDDFVLRERLLP